jgi:hypothetical protein
VNGDLLNAERALARGNTDEARVHAWNALATVTPQELTRLRELATELDDQLLLREIDRRGLPVELPEGHPPFQRRSLIFPIVLAILILVFAVNTVSTEPGAPKPGASDIAAIPQEGLPLLTQGSGVWIVQIGRSERVPLQKLADDLSLRYRIPVGVMPEIALLPPYALDRERDELDGDALLRVLREWYGARGSAAIIGITDFPMFSETLDLRHPFMLRDGAHFGIVSTADLGASLWARIRGHTRYERTRKLVARGIGFLYLRRPVSSDEHSLLRSQMSGTGDIDALDERL